MTAYIDSSVVLRYILKGENSIRHALECDKVISSEIMEIECRRVIHRYRMQNELDDQAFVIAVQRLEEFLDGVSIIKLSEAVKKIAMGAFPVIIKTLDALHVATALEYAKVYSDEKVSIYSYDESMNRCACVLGFDVPFFKIKSKEKMFLG